jgi:hypothetical protein
MATWQPLKKDVIDALAAEILQNYSTGRIAVDGATAAGGREFAENLAAALRESGRTVTVATSDENFDTDLLLVAGKRLQVPELAGKWRYAIWVEADDEAGSEYIRQVKPRVKANAIIDNRDPEHPRRVFADSC